MKPLANEQPHFSADSSTVTSSAERLKCCGCCSIWEQNWTSALPTHIKAAFCFPLDHISSSKLVLLHLSTVGNYCDFPAKIFTPGGSAKTHLLQSDGQWTEPVPLTCNTQTQGQRGKVRGEGERLFCFFLTFKNQASTSSPECSNVFHSVGEAPREAEANCPKNCGKNNQVISQVQT